MVTVRPRPRPRALGGVLWTLALACQPAPGGAPRANGALVSSEAASPAPAASAAQGLLARAVPAGWRLPLPLSAPVVRAERFLVVSDSPLATRAGVAVLDRGGNAFDATVPV